MLRISIPLWRMAGLTLALFASIGAGAQEKSKYLWYQYGSGLGTDGYDLVAYFEKGKAVRGDSQHAVEHAGQRWLFSSAKHLKLFEKNPDKYLPVYGSHCAFGASRGYLVRGDPQAWTVHNGKLYLNYSKAVRRTWLKNPDRYIASADRHWPRLLRKQTQ